MTLVEAATLLQITSQSTLEDVQRYFRIRAQHIHPDKFQSAGEKEFAHTQMQQLSAARSILENHWQAQQSFTELDYHLDQRQARPSQKAAAPPDIKRDLVVAIKLGEEALYLYYLYSLHRPQLRTTAAGLNSYHDYNYLLQRSLRLFERLRQPIQSQYDTYFFERFQAFGNFFSAFQRAAECRVDSDFSQSKLEQMIFVQYKKGVEVLDQLIQSYSEAGANLSSHRIRDMLIQRLREVSLLFSSLLKKHRDSMWVEDISLKGELAFYFFRFLEAL